MGGINAVTVVTVKFLYNVAADSAINAQFAAKVADPACLQLFRFDLIDQICAGTGRISEYKGKNMLKADQGIYIIQEEFNALVGGLAAVLDFFCVFIQEKNDFLFILGPLQLYIVSQ